MKNILFLLLLIFGTLSTFAQNWQTDINTAKDIAEKENKLIILVFQGSDWCAPCMKLDREIWSTDEFILYAQDHFVMLKADFPRKRKNALTKEQQEKNNNLAEKYNKKGYFPFVVVMNSSGEVIGTTGYDKIKPTEYIKRLESFKK